MVQLPDVTLSQRAQRWLLSWQAEIDSLPTFEAKVAFVEQHWANRNRGSNRTFQEIRRVLRGACSGNLGCPYCETSVGKTIDHFRPKAIYPELTFVWANLIPACSDCQSVKGSRFRICRQDTGGHEDLSLGTEPAAGVALLINPREEDPSEFLELDLATGEFLERAVEGTPEYARASYTLQLLELNARNELRRARQKAYRTFRLHLEEYAQYKEAEAPEVELNQLCNALLALNYQAVWEEMKRQVRLYPNFYPELTSLFQRVPEAFDWHWHTISGTSTIPYDVQY